MSQELKRQNPSVLILPGWQGSGADHWQMRWVRTHGYHCVEQHDWDQPKRGDWVARLHEVIEHTRSSISPGVPLVLVAHSLGCHLVAAWHQHARSLGLAHGVVGALLVAPPDVGQEPLATLLPQWRQPVLEALPFASTVIYSSNDAYASEAASLRMAAAWGSEVRAFGHLGHINADSGLGDWECGHAELRRLIERASDIG